MATGDGRGFHIRARWRWPAPLAADFNPQRVAARGRRGGVVTVAHAQLQVGRPRGQPSNRRLTGPQALSLRHLVQRIGHGRPLVGGRRVEGGRAVRERLRPARKLRHRPAVQEHARGRRNRDDPEHDQVVLCRHVTLRCEARRTGHRRPA